MDFYSRVRSCYNSYSGMCKEQLTCVCEELPMNQKSEGGEQQKETEEELELPEAAPTDYRGNVWLLVFMVGVVIVAWVVAQLRHMF